MAILLSYYYQLKFYDTILEEMAVEDTGPLYPSSPLMVGLLSLSQ